MLRGSEIICKLRWDYFHPHLPSRKARTTGSILPASQVVAMWPQSESRTKTWAPIAFDKIFSGHGIDHVVLRGHRRPGHAP